MGNTTSLTSVTPERVRGRAMPLLDASQPPREIVLKRVRTCRSAGSDIGVDVITSRSRVMRAAEAAP